MRIMNRTGSEVVSEQTNLPLERRHYSGNGRSTCVGSRAVVGRHRKFAGSGEGACRCFLTPPGWCRGVVGHAAQFFTRTTPAAGCSVGILLCFVSPHPELAVSRPLIEKESYKGPKGKAP